MFPIGLSLSVFPWNVINGLSEKNMAWSGLEAQIK